MIRTVTTGCEATHQLVIALLQRGIGRPQCVHACLHVRCPSIELCNLVLSSQYNPCDAGANARLIGTPPLSAGLKRHGTMERDVRYAHIASLPRNSCIMQGAMTTEKQLFWPCERPVKQTFMTV